MSKKEFTPQMEQDIADANSSLLYLLDLLTPYTGTRTPTEQVYFENILMAAKKLPINNLHELRIYH